MDIPRYTYTFEHFGERLKEGHVRLIDYQTGQSHDLQVAIDDKQLSLISYQALYPLLSDLVDIAAAVHMADRLAKSKENLPRSLLLRLPIREQSMINTPMFSQKLQNILYWFTEDYWSFEFLPYTKRGRFSEIQPHLPLRWKQTASTPTRVLLWSGGLDAFAGAYQLLLQDADTRYLLFGTGNNTMISHKQKDIAEDLGVLFPRRTQLVQLPFRLKDESKKVDKNSSARSRGFIFLLLGAVCAMQQGLRSLFVCENGVGAINLPFRKSEVGLDHARSVHPLSLAAMSELLSYVFTQPFTIENPFLTWTKAQMCREPLYEMSARKIAFSTISCDSRHRSRPMQCGYCSSCLLRRQAIAAHGIIDGTGYLTQNEAQRKRKPSDGTHYHAMQSQVHTMRDLFNVSDPWPGLSRQYRSLIDIVDQAEQPQIMISKLLTLYNAYVQEWDTAQQAIGIEFLE